MLPFTVKAPAKLSQTSEHPFRLATIAGPSIEPKCVHVYTDIFVHTHKTFVSIQPVLIILAQGNITTETDILDVDLYIYIYIYICVYMCICICRSLYKHIYITIHIYMVIPKYAWEVAS